VHNEHFSCRLLNLQKLERGFMSRKLKKIEIEIKFSDKKCSREEKLYMQARLVCLLMKWDNQEKLQKAQIK